MNACACMGPMYGEPHCYCEMKGRGLPLNEPAREIERVRAEAQLDALFGPGGIWHRAKLPANVRLLTSRNKREGKYAGQSSHSKGNKVKHWRNSKEWQAFWNELQ